MNMAAWWPDRMSGRYMPYLGGGGGGGEALRGGNAGGGLRSDEGRLGSESIFGEESEARCRGCRHEFELSKGPSQRLLEAGGRRVSHLDWNGQVPAAAASAQMSAYDLA